MTDLIYWVGGTALTLDPKNPVIHDCVIGIQGTKIISLQSSVHFEPPPEAKVLKTKNCLILPGLINGHTHVGMSLFRGLGQDLPLHSWLKDFVFPLEKKWISPELVQIATQLSLVEMIRSGTSTFNDMYYYEKEIVKVTEELGLRAVCSPTLISREDNFNRVGLEDLVEPFLEFVGQRKRITPGVAPHAIYSMSRKALEETISFCKERNLRMHIHVSETEQEVKDCLSQHKKTPVEYLRELGAFEVSVIAAHCCDLSNKDIEILGEYKVGVIHNPESNMKLGNKICPITRLMGAGAKVGLGTDGVMSNNNIDLFEEVDFAAKLQSYLEGPGSLSTAQAVHMMTLGGAQALHLEDDIGSIEIGKEADLIAVDLEQSHLQPFYDPASTVVYSCSGKDVVHHMVAGKMLMQSKELKTIDESYLFKQVKNWSQKIRTGNY